MTRDRRDYMSKGVKVMMDKPTKTADPSLWDLTDPGLIAEEPEWDQYRQSTCG